MALSFPQTPWSRFKVWFLGIFNLDENRWGRSDGSASPSRSSDAPDQDPHPSGQSPGEGSKNPDSDKASKPGKKQPQSPPDLDELWREFNRKLGHLFGGAKNTRRGGPQGPGGGGGSGPGFPWGSFQARSFAALVLGGLVLIWLGTGFYIVQEGQQAVITRFGRFLGPEVGIKGAGFNWRLPWPIERHEIVRVSQLRSVDIGRSTVVQNTGLRDLSMLTQDENIVDVRFVVQYRVKDPAEFLFNHVDPDQAVVYSAESAIREVVGKGSMNTVLNEKREAIAGDIVKSIQSQLDLYKAGILVSSVNIQNVQPPEQVQAAFDDALKAGQDGDRTKNEGQAYANEVVSRAEGAAARLREESEGYKARVVAQADGDAERFKSIYQEYKKAPQVTRDRMYLDAMSQIYSSVSKVMVDARQGTTLLNLPLEKILQMSQGVESSSPVAPSPAPAPVAASPANAATSSSVDNRGRDTARSRDREGR